MTAATDRDELMRKAEEVLRENRIALARSEHTGERMLTALYAYIDAMHNLLRRVGIELPEPSRRRRRRRRF